MRGPTPLSFGQEGLWLLSQLDPADPAYHVPIAVRLRGRLSVEALTAALGEVVRRHESLRTSFPADAGTPSRRVHEDWTPDLPLTDAGGEAAAARRADELGRRPFDLCREPPLRAELLRLGPDDHLLMLCVHHIAADAASMAIVFRELSALYAAFLSGGRASLPDPPLQYGDFAVRQRERMAEAGGPGLAFWRHHLSPPPPELDLSILPEPDAGRAGPMHAFPIEAALVDGVRRLAGEERASLFMALAAAFQLLVHRSTGARDLLVGTAVSGRNRPELRDAVGHFVNTVPLRSRLPADASVRDMLRATRSAALDAYEHQDVPFELLVRELAPDGPRGRSPLVTTMFTLVDRPEDSLRLPGLAIDLPAMATGAAKFDLSLELRPYRGGLMAKLEHRAAVIGPTAGARMGGHYLALLRGMADGPDLRAWRLPLLARDETEQLASWNRTGRDAAAPAASIVGLLRARAEARPDEPAVETSAGTLTYRELHRRAACVTSRVLAAGLGAGDVVGVCARRSPALVAALVGILGSGAAYVPLDPDHPPARWAQVLARTGVRMLVGDADLLERVPDAPPERLALDPALWDAGPVAAPAPRLPVPHQLAYVLHTSGSTGEPKGVMVEHASLANLVRALDALTGVGPGSRVLQHASIGFDASVWEILVTLASGGTLCMAERGDMLPGPDLARTLRERRITSAMLTPSALAVTDPAGLPDLRTVISIGEPCTPALVEKWGGGRRVLNGYGPTEATVVVAVGECRPGERTVTVGGALPNVELRVLDAELQPVPVGVTGELYAGGACLSRGYLGRPDLTAERFVPDPMCAGPGRRLYRTGDLARHTAGGELEILGRADSQVKVRGQRVELGEVEAVLERHPDVRRAAVTLRPVAEGDPRLVAHVVAAVDDSGLPARLRAFVAERLPAAMVPAAFVAMPALPSTPSGKVDRAALPVPEPTSLAASAGGADAATEAERALAGIWAELLGVTPTVDDDFFSLGGHSLLVARLVARTRERLGVDLAMRAVFDRPRLGDLAAGLDAASPGAPSPPPLLPVPRDEPLPLSYAQDRLWFVEQLSPGLGLHNIASARRVHGEAPRRLVARCLADLVGRHEALRTAFAAPGGRPVQVLLPPAAPAVREVDAGDVERAAQVMRDEADRPFDLRTAPLLRATIVRLPGGESLLLLVVHHLVADGWSIDLLWRELATLWRAHRDGAEPRLAGLPVQPADHAAWQRRQVAEGALAERVEWWRRHLLGAPRLVDLPRDRPRPPVQTFRGDVVPVGLPAEAVRAAGDLARAEGTSVFMVLLAAFHALLHRSGGQDDVLVGTPFAGRDAAETAGLVGLFANTLPVRLRFPRGITGRELLRAARGVVLDAFAHQDVPFERIVEDLGLAGSAGHSPLFQVVFVLEEAGREDPDDPFDGPPLAVPTHLSRFDLTLILRRDGEAVTGGLEYSRDLFDEATARRLAGQYRTLAAAMVAGPDTPIERLAVMTPEEVEAELRGWNATETRLPGDGCLHRLVEAWARREPDRTAVAAGPAGSLTYAELDRAAGALAGRLVGLGAGPERLVAVHLDRSPALVVALLATWKAGAAYLPLDPDHPDAWLDGVVADARPVALLTSAGLRGRLAAPGVPVIAVDEPAPAAAGAAAAAPHPLDVACVLYTSGSTGQPKGVALPHLAVANVVHQRNAVHAVSGEDRVLQSFSPAFDPSIWQVFGPLVAGATVVLPEAGRHRDLEHLVDVVERERVTIFDSTPSLLASLLELPDLARAFATVRAVFCGGEPLANDVNDRFLERTGCRLTAIYGITEACVDVTSWACRPMAAAGSVPIGRPVANKRIHVLDRHLAPVPVGVPGELCVGGPALARGYLGRPDLTAAAFVPDPLSGEPGARLYRTGDLGRRLPGGDLEFLGRRDEQVKLRGHRVEAGQVEHALREHAAVSQAVVAVVADGEAEPRLVAYVVPAGPAPERHELVAHLRARLPAFMVPAAFVVVEAIPLTDTGKLDRRRLPAPLPAAEPAAGGSTPTQAAIAAIWREVLGIDTVAVTDDFFDVGGHSLSATRMLARVEETLGVEIPVRVLLVDSTVAALAAAVEEASAGS